MPEQPVPESTQLARERTVLAHDRTDLAGERTDLAGERTDLAVERTVLAHERTMMAWVRTATSQISFGFTIYKFFDYLDENNKAALQRQWLGPREFAMIIISIGLVALILATVNHRKSLSALRASGATVPWSLAEVIGVLVAAFGVLGFVLAWLRR